MTTETLFWKKQLKRFLLLAVICALGIVMSTSALSSQEEPMKIRVNANGETIVYQLNSSTASKELYAQLPLKIKVEDYGVNEKIFYPPNKLKTENTPLVDSVSGSLAYYAPWGDVVMFYEDFGKASGLYDLGHAVSGIEHIPSLSGTISIEKADQ